MLVTCHHVHRSHFGPIGRGLAVSARLGGFTRLGWCGAVSRPKEQRSSSLPDIPSLRRTSSVGENVCSPRSPLTFVGTAGPIITSVASSVPSGDLGRPWATPSICDVGGVGVKHGNSGVDGVMSKPCEG